ncbi:hypothetical protein ACQEUV_33140 [Micromonospora aurantiaca (nom. illeg.)]|uniref:hypothetical protein n=1 Tax=Micromonospora aurantiaca (nom. illeg.) TaxID=47850 RepID=UPI003DA4AEBB
MGIKLKASLPRWEQSGLALIRDQLLEFPEGQHVAIVVLDCVSIKHDVVDGDLEATPTVRLLRIEPETDPDEAARLLAHAKRLTDKRIPPPTKPDPIPGLDLPGGSGVHLTSVGGGQRA